MPALALTFDDGPDPEWTPAVLDALAAVGASATFFVLGARVVAHPELVRRTVREGHAVGVHGFGHVRHTEQEGAAGVADLDRALGELAAVDVVPTLWRTPWGVEAEWTRPAAESHGLRLVAWTTDTHDWRGDAADTMLTAVEPAVADGAIVLAHDGLGPGALRTGCAETVALIAPLIELGRARGLAAEALA
jgi:peptidoglycan/xylan/chitin deacetylase (PgdA/CDA1 family)